MPTETVVGAFLDQPDKSDSLNQIIVVGARRLIDGRYVGGWRAPDITLTDPKNMDMRGRAIALAIGQLVELVRRHPGGDPRFVAHGGDAAKEK